MSISSYFFFLKASYFFLIFSFKAFIFSSFLFLSISAQSLSSHNLLYFCIFYYLTKSFFLILPGSLVCNGTVSSLARAFLVFFYLEVSNLGGNFSNSPMLEQSSILCLSPLIMTCLVVSGTNA